MCRSEVGLGFAGVAMCVKFSFCENERRGRKTMTKVSTRVRKWFEEFAKGIVFHAARTYTSFRLQNFRCVDTLHEVEYWSIVRV